MNSGLGDLETVGDSKSRLNFNYEKLFFFGKLTYFKVIRFTCLCVVNAFIFIVPANANTIGAVYRIFEKI